MSRFSIQHDVLSGGYSCYLVDHLAGRKYGIEDWSTGEPLLFVTEHAMLLEAIRKAEILQSLGYARPEMHLAPWRQ